LNKKFDSDIFPARRIFCARKACLRAFVLVKPPFMDDAEGWMGREIGGVAFSLAPRWVTLIPTRSGNGAMEAIARAGEFAPPRLAAFGTRAGNALTCASEECSLDTWIWNDSPDCFACLENGSSDCTGLIFPNISYQQSTVQFAATRSKQHFQSWSSASGFCGSLHGDDRASAWISTGLIERGRHPRFVMGESSTPLANLLLEEI